MLTKTGKGSGKLIPALGPMVFSCSIRRGSNIAQGSGGKT